MNQNIIFKNFVNTVGETLKADPALVEAITKAFDVITEATQFSAEGMDTVTDPFLRGYLEAMFFTGVDVGDTETGEGSYDLGMSDLSKQALETATSDCKNFMDVASELLDIAVSESEGYTMEHAGHDFWLTRNRHGAGYWDRGLSVGKQLTDIAHTFGECHAYQGDDSLVYFM